MPVGKKESAVKSWTPPKVSNPNATKERAVWTSDLYNWLLPTMQTTDPTYEFTIHEFDHNLADCELPTHFCVTGG